MKPRIMTHFITQLSKVVIPIKRRRIIDADFGGCRCMPSGKDC